MVFNEAIIEHLEDGLGEALARLEKPHPPDPLPTDRYIALAVQELVREAHADNTRKAYQSDLRAFRTWGGDVPTTPQELARYIAEEGQRLHPSTIQRRLAALSVAHKLSGGLGHALKKSSGECGLLPCQTTAGPCSILTRSAVCVS